MKLCDKKMADRIGLDIPPMSRGDHMVTAAIYVATVLCFLGAVALGLLLRYGR